MNTGQFFKKHRVLSAILATLFLLSLAGLTYGNYLSGAVLWQLAVSGILLGIQLLAFYFLIGVLVIAGQQMRSQAQFGKSLSKFIYFTPRIAGLLITVFVGLFALDVFSEGLSFWETVGGFLMHALPAIVMAVVLALAWRRPLIGFIAFLFAAVAFLRFVIQDPVRGIGLLLLFSGPMAIIASLFWVNWKWQKKLYPAEKPQANI